MSHFILSNSPAFSFLASAPATRSCTSVCIVTDLTPPQLKAFLELLDKEGVARDIASYRDAPAGIRIWCGPTVQLSDLNALLPWLRWRLLPRLLSPPLQLLRTIQGLQERAPYTVLSFFTVSVLDTFHQPAATLLVQVKRLCTVAALVCSGGGQENLVGFALTVGKLSRRRRRCRRWRCRRWLRRRR